MDEQVNLVEIMQRFNNEDTAREYLEHIRWSSGAVCPHCGSIEAYRLSPRQGSTRSVRKGVLKCKACRKQFTVTVGTIFEDSHIPLHKWLIAVYLMCSSKKGVSALQLQRMLTPLTYKSAWFMCHRIRYAMSQPPLVGKLKGVVEADETYIGGKSHGKRGRGAEGKIPVVALIERDGRARSFKVKDVKTDTVQALIRNNVEGTAHIMTDSFPVYRGLAKQFAGHGIIDHNKEYVRGIIHTNFAESYFSLLKRGILGTFHHVSEQHLQRYLDEFNFRWSLRKNGDGERTVNAIEGAEGKRLMFKEPVSKIV